MYSVNLEEWRGPRQSWFKCRHIYLEYRLSLSLLRPSAILLCPWASVFPTHVVVGLHSSRALVTVHTIQLSLFPTYRLRVIAHAHCNSTQAVYNVGYLVLSHRLIYMYVYFDVKMSIICWTSWLFLLCWSYTFSRRNQRIDLSRRKILVFLRSCT